MVNRSGNPFLSDKRFAHLSKVGKDGKMTVDGTANKSLLLVGIVIIVAALTWWGSASGAIGDTALWICCIIAALLGLVIAITLAFKPQWSPGLGPLYAALQGVFVGAVSLIAEQQFPGIVLQAVGLTFAVALVMLALFRSGIIKVTRGFWIGVLIATAAVVLTSIVVWVLSLIGVSGPANAIYGSGPIGIIFSLIVIIIATMNLLVDFAFITSAADHGYPKFFEWYGAFALCVTLVWLYIEILRLLIKLRSRD